MSHTAYLPTLPTTYAVRVVSVVTPGEGWRRFLPCFVLPVVLKFCPVRFGRGYLAEFLHAWD